MQSPEPGQLHGSARADDKAQAQDRAHAGGEATRLNDNHPQQAGGERKAARMLSMICRGGASGPEARPRSGGNRPMSGHCDGPSLAKLGSNLTKLVQSGRGWRACCRVGSETTRYWPNLTKRWPTSTVLGQPWSDFAHEVRWLCQKQVPNSQKLFTLGHIWGLTAAFRQLLSDVEAASELAGPAWGYPPATPWRTTLRQLLLAHPWPSRKMMYYKNAGNKGFEAGGQTGDVLVKHKSGATHLLYAACADVGNTGAQALVPWASWGRRSIAWPILDMSGTPNVRCPFVFSPTPARHRTPPGPPN